MNAIDDCIYHKFSRSKHIFPILYVNDILLANDDICLLYEIRRFLSNKFDIKDLGDAFFCVSDTNTLRSLFGYFGLS